MNLEKNVPLQPYNTFGIAAKAHALVRVRSEADLLAVLADPQLARLRQLIQKRWGETLGLAQIG